MIRLLPILSLALLSTIHAYAPSFVAKNNGIVSPMPKVVQGLAKNQAVRKHENTIKMMPVSFSYVLFALVLLVGLLLFSQFCWQLDIQY
jgi:K+-transporting ATPase A subunit